MKLIYSAVLIFFLFQSPYSFSQIPTINLDIIQTEINGGNPLPSEESFYIRGAIPKNIEMVQVSIFQSKKSESKAYSYFWKAPFGYEELSYQVLVSDPLRSSEEYDLRFSFYRQAGKDQMEEVRNLIFQNIETYLSTVTTVQRGKIKFLDSNELILSRLNQIVEEGAYYFELPNGKSFSGFSDLIKNKLEQGRKLKLKDAKLNLPDLEEDQNARAAYAATYLKELQSTLKSEVNQYLTPNMLVRVDELSFQKYPTEKKPNSLTLNAGYGAIMLSQGLPEREFVSSPYAGLSFPLGNRAFSRFMNNLTLSTGVFISGKMENSLNERISGPLLDRPVYAGLGYNIFRFFRINAGATFLTTNQMDGSKNRTINPYVGISADFRIWLGLGNK
ncbi:hypothetical protein SAMN04488104_10605 [Algoriphagus faecimaris]|uniref:Outer membrane protein beta-barrel domain-containing protein n=1 Tax=Algoriphagus faecimaris TaxID=686796 RepID=A0A1G6XJ41_9BACT|nr:hypothetical protein [Algoriphagus faecimaris]SDD78092.1 hypothetical protein SAMN04488104_10605 [Algoriphagus faecimaris]